MSSEYYVVTSRKVDKQAIVDICTRYRNCTFVLNESELSGDVILEGKNVCSTSNPTDFESSTLRNRTGQINGASFLYTVKTRDELEDEEDELSMRICCAMALSGEGIALNPEDETIFFVAGFEDYIFDPNRGATIDIKVVNKEIKKVIRPLLKEAGFINMTGRKAWRYSDDNIEHLYIKSFNSHTAYVAHCTTFSFSITVGIFFDNTGIEKFGRTKNGLLVPEDYNCHFRKSLHRNIEQKRMDTDGIWLVNPNGDNVSLVVNDAKRSIVEQALPWFEHYRDLDNARALLELEHIPWEESMFMGEEGSETRLKLKEILGSY